MQIQELARQLAQVMGTPLSVAVREYRRFILADDLRVHGLPNDAASVYRLEDMIDNLCEEAWGDWDRKHGMSVQPHDWQEYNAHHNSCHFPGCTLEEGEHPNFGKAVTPKCSICKRELNVPGDEDSIDCGGDCAACMKEEEDRE